ncbi:MAG TPA: ABC transporter permease [Flavitalea sp.]|nr:ABC transporter permease [Flavitalea sp.]
MLRFLDIIWSSFKIALQEFRSNKLRTFLSLFGITIGIFCIISVLSTVGSLEHAIQKDIKALGSNTVYIDKWEYGGGGEYPWWKYMKRPEPKYEEMKVLKLKVPAASNVAFALQGQGNIEFGDDMVTGVNQYGVTEEFVNIQPVEVMIGRSFQQSDYDRGANFIVMGYIVSEKLFGKAEKGLNQEVTIKGKKAIIIGVIKKQGKSIIGGWEFDNSVLLVRGFMKQLIVERYANPIIMVQGREDVPMAALKDELAGAMRSLRKLKPTQDDDFSLNDIDSFSNAMHDIFSGVNKGGWAIAGLSLIVGMFGVANIMFVTVRERTSQIGLKKAIGAKKSTILTEFLLEAAFLCILGGMMGLLLVFILTKVIAIATGFPLFISVNIMMMAIGICILVGVLAGIIPASIAARMDPVVAIRSK